MIKKTIIFFTSICALIVFVSVLMAATVAPSAVGDQSSATNQNSRVVSPGDHPVELLIPSIKVNARIQDVGITRLGNMGTPNNYTDVGWYEYGTVPGTNGSAVIAGHVDNGLALPGVFKNLGNVKVGDDIYVHTETGKELHFIVTDITIYDYKTAPTDLIFNQTGAARLRLITCTGNWVAADRTDDHRIVVTSILKN